MSMFNNWSLAVFSTSKQGSCLVLVNAQVISTLQQIGSNKNVHNDSKHKREHYK